MGLTTGLALGLPMGFIVGMARNLALGLTRCLMVGLIKDFAVVFNQGFTREIDKMFDGKKRPAVWRCEWPGRFGREAEKLIGYGDDLWFGHLLAWD